MLPDGGVRIVMDAAPRLHSRRRREFEEFKGTGNLNSTSIASSRIAACSRRPTSTRAAPGRKSYSSRRKIIRVRARAERTDTDIARDAAHRFAQHRGDSLTVQAVVRDGHVTLDGTVSWMHQRAAAETAVRYLAGVTGISNEIVICSPAS